MLFVFPPQVNTSHFSNVLHCFCLGVICSLVTGITPYIYMLRFVLINSVLLSFLSMAHFVTITAWQQGTAVNILTQWNPCKNSFKMKFFGRKKNTYAGLGLTSSMCCKYRGRISSEINVCTMPSMEDCTHNVSNCRQPSIPNELTANFSKEKREREREGEREGGREGERGSDTERERGRERGRGRERER